MEKMPKGNFIKNSKNDDRIKENLELIKKIQDCKDIEERKTLEGKLIALNKKFIWHIVNKHGRWSHIVNKHGRWSMITKEELFAAGLEGFAKAIKAFKFNPDNPTFFVRFFYICIRNEVLMKVREEQKFYGRVVPFDSPIRSKKKGDSEDCDEVTYEDILFSDYDSIKKHHSKELRENIIKIIEERCDPLEQVTLKGMYGLGEDGIIKVQREIAEEVGHSRSCIAKIAIAGREKIKEGLKERYNEDELTF